MGIGEYASDSLEVNIVGAGFGRGTSGVGCSGGTKVGYLVDVSCRNVSMSSGEDLIGMAL
jgi:hypothetical protein